MAEAPRGRLLLDLYAAQQLSGNLIEQELERDGVTADLYGLLTQIAVSGPVAPTRLANEIGIPPTTLYDYADRLVERGHLVRRANPRDGRSHHLEVTPEGRAVVRKGGKAIARVLGALVEHLDGATLEELEAALFALRRALEGVRLDV